MGVLLSVTECNRDLLHVRWVIGRDGTENERVVKSINILNFIHPVMLACK